MVVKIYGGLIVKVSEISLVFQEFGLAVELVSAETREPFLPAGPLQVPEHTQ